MLTENPKFFLYIGSAYLGLGEKDLAEQAFSTCAELSKNDPKHREIFLLATEKHI